MITRGRNIPEEFKQNGADRSYDEIFALICKNIRVEFPKRRFVYFIDQDYVMDTTKGYRYENLTPAYWKILSSGLEQLKYPDADTGFCESYNGVLNGLCILAERIVDKLAVEEPEEREKAQWFKRIKDRPAAGFEEAIQRLLFINQVFWQTDHRLTGLGAWDFYLYPYFEKDMEAGRLTEEEALCIIEEVYRILHDNYEYKSNVLMGDTGQIFVLGRSDLEGNYCCNKLTYLFIEAMKEVQLPEPKCLLRVNRKTPRELVELSLRAIVTGIGAPLFANDDVVIPGLIEFGIAPEDACEYTTSACWEPLIGGKSTSLNNMTALNYLKALDNLFKRADLEGIHNFEELVDCYLVFLRRNLNAVKRVLEPHRFQYNPLLSVFTEGCYEKKEDVSWGGARYHHVGITSVAIGNLVDSLMNIKELVFDTHEYSLTEVKQILISDFQGYEELKENLRKKEKFYGTDEEIVVDLTNHITGCVSEEIKGYRNYLGGKMKVGLSGPAYIDAARDFGASFDGRRKGEPFTVHISNEDNHGFTEVIRFASQMEYDRSRFNGNVVDLMVSPDFINNNWDKFVDFLMLCIDSGFFELQMNVVSSRTLIAARKNPERFPNLIVRVWGFSAYFKDLPEEYKEVLINRALKNEKEAVA